MNLIVSPVEDATVRSALCAQIIKDLPRWFGRPEANARYIRDVANRDAFAGYLDGVPCGLIALEYHFHVTCNIWWLGVSPTATGVVDHRDVFFSEAEHQTNAKLCACVSRVAGGTITIDTGDRQPGHPPSAGCKSTG